MLLKRRNATQNQELLRLRHKFRMESIKARQRLNYLAWAIPEVNSRLATTSAKYSNYQRNPYKLNRNQPKNVTRVVPHRHHPEPLQNLRATRRTPDEIRAKSHPQVKLAKQPTKILTKLLKLTIILTTL